MIWAREHLWWGHDYPALPAAMDRHHPESFWVQDASGQTVGWFYFRHNEETAHRAKVLTRDGAGRIANFARLPEVGKRD